MNPYMSIRHKTRGKFRLGDVVRVIHGWGGALGEVIEDYGLLGSSRFYTVRVRIEDTPEMPFAEDELELVERPAKDGDNK